MEHSDLCLVLEYFEKTQLTLEAQIFHTYVYDIFESLTQNIKNFSHISYTYIIIIKEEAYRHINVTSNF